MTTFCLNVVFTDENRDKDSWILVDSCPFLKVWLIFKVDPTRRYWNSSTWKLLQSTGFKHCNRTTVCLFPTLNVIYPFRMTRESLLSKTEFTGVSTVLIRNLKMFSTALKLDLNQCCHNSVLLCLRIPASCQVPAAMIDELWGGEIQKLNGSGIFLGNFNSHLIQCTDNPKERTTCTETRVYGGTSLTLSCSIAEPHT